MEAVVIPHVELFNLNRYTGEYNFSYIVSADISVGLALSEICYGQIVVDGGTCWGHSGFRPGGLGGLCSNHWCGDTYLNY